MFKISRKQMDAFSLASREGFENRMVTHLVRFFPERCLGEGENWIRQLINQGIAHAARHGIVTESDVCKYIDLMLVLGRNFDEEPDLKWAQDILWSKDLPTPGARINALYDEALRYVGRVAGQPIVRTY